MSQLVSNIIISLFCYILIGYSFKIVYSSIYFFHIVHAISLTLGAYVVYTVCIMWGWSLWVAVPLSVLFGVLLMLAVNQWIYKPLQERNLESWQMMIASLGLYVVLQNIVSMVWGDSTLSFRTWEVKVGHEILGAYITDVQIITIVASIVLLLGSWLFCEKTQMGRKIKAVSSNPELSHILGISRDKAVIWSFILGSGLAACAGILIAADTDMTPTMGFNWLLYAVVAMIIGGKGKIRHLILGALMLSTCQHLAAYFIDSKWMNATAYVILIIFLCFRPYGFSGERIKKVEI